MTVRCRVGMLDGLRRWVGSRGRPRAISAGRSRYAVESRELGLADYLGIPAVARARQLIISIVAELEPVAYRDGYPLAEQPRVLTPAGARDHAAGVPRAARRLARSITATRVSGTR